MRRGVWVSLGMLVACGTHSATPPGPRTPDRPAQRAAKPNAFRADVPTPGARSQLRYPQPEVSTLPNGLKVFVTRRPAGVVSMALAVRHAGNTLAAGKSGLSALVARLLTESTRKKTSLELAEAVESLGSGLIHDAGRDEASIQLTTLKADFDAGLGLLAEVVTLPRFDPAEFARVKNEWLDGLISERQEPGRLASLAGLRLLVGPVEGAPVAGSVPDVKRLNLADVIDFHRRRYQPTSAALVVAGDISLDEVRRAAQRHFGAWKAGPAAKASASKLPAPPTGRRLYLIDRPGAVQSAVFMAAPLPARSDSGYEARQIMSGVFGGLFTSRINQNLREKHAYTYGARSQALATSNWGAFVISTSVHTEVTQPALDQLFDELAKISEPRGLPIRDEELQRAKADLINSLGAHLERTERVLGDVVEQFSDQLALDYFSGFEARIESVPGPEVQKQAAEWLRPERFVTVIAGDRAKIEAPLRKHGYAIESAPAALTE